MKLQGVLVLLGGVAIFAALMPSAPNTSPGAQPVLEGEQTAQIDTLQSSEWFGGDMVLRRQDDGHFYVNAQVQGADVRFMIDTGASVVALTGEDAMAAGLEWSESEIRNIGQGASGAVYGVPAHVEELVIGDFVARNVSAAIIPEGLGISLLGQSVLTQVENVRIEGDTMVLAAQ